MLSYIGKLIHTILPSVLATVLGAYVVNFYILPKAGADKPPAAASAPAEAAKSDSKSAPKPEPVSLPLKAVEPAASPKASEPRARVIEKQVEDKRRPDKAVEKPEKSDEAAEARKHQARDKAAGRAPVAVAPTPALEPAATPEERRDANDLARAAIERLRGSGEAVRDNEPVGDKPRTTEAAPAPRTPAPVAQGAPSLQHLPHAMQPLPPAISLNEPSPEFRGETQQRASGDFGAQGESNRNLRPPGSIPDGSMSPIELHGEAQRQTVADDVMSAARSVFQSVIPGR